MKISVNEEELFTLSEIQKKVIQNDIPTEIFEDDMKRRLKWVLLDEKYTKCMQRLRKEWEPIFKSEGTKMLPTDDDKFAQLVFAHPKYKNRSQREKEEITNKNS